MRLVFLIVLSKIKITYCYPEIFRVINHAEKARIELHVVASHAVTSPTFQFVQVHISRKVVFIKRLNKVYCVDRLRLRSYHSSRDNNIECGHNPWDLMLHVGRMLGYIYLIFYICTRNGQCV